MKREFKFRAFETKKARGRMFSWDEIKTDFLSYLNCKDTIIGQYTGMKDSEGVDIYEGDIVTCPLRKKSTVVYRDHGFWVESESFGWEGEDLWDWNRIKVIGNIYENPNLLDK